MTNSETLYMETEQMTEAEELYLDQYHENQLEEYMLSKCDECGKHDSSTEYIESLESSFCDECLGNGYTKCDSCYSYFPDDMIRDVGIYICEYCYD